MSIKNGDMPVMLGGYRVIISEDQRYEFTFDRSWKERLFTMPFRPFKRTRTEVTWSNHFKDGQVVKNGSNIHMSNKMYIALLAQLEEKGE